MRRLPVSVVRSALLTIVILSNIGLALVTSASSVQDQDLEGVWGCERILGPSIRGQLHINHVASSWKATIAGVSVPVDSDSGKLAFTLSGGQGDFRGSVTKHGMAIEGHWIQPASSSGGPRYASPVALSRTTAGNWEGNVDPLQDKLSLYLVFQRQPDGSLAALLRNPERGLGASRSLWKVTREGENIRITGFKWGDITAKLNKETGVLTATFPFSDSAFDLTRRSADSAPGFYSRTPLPNRYRYRQPAATNDGWPTASLSAVGMDQNRIADLVDYILKTPVFTPRPPLIQGLLIARHGKLVLDEYFYGFDSDLPHDTRSAAKTL
ncbi:MAG TPA: 6-aminohexanoate hydrolase, partial [Blastocatellia bacterium]